MEWDLAILNTGDGGDLTLKGNDLGVFFNGEGELFLRMFGGNVQANTKSKRVPGEQDFSYWGNYLFMANDPDIQFNSETERAFQDFESSSQGRATIENAIKKDLQGTDTTVTVSIVSTDKIYVTLKRVLPNGSERYGTIIFKKGTDTRDFEIEDFSVIDFN